MAEQQPAVQLRPKSGASSARSRPTSSASRRSLKSPVSDASFHTAVGGGTLTDRTLVDSSEIRRQRHLSDDEGTLADSIVDSMHSCAETLVGSEDDITLHDAVEGEDTDHEDEDDADAFLSMSEHVPSDTNIRSYSERLREGAKTPTQGRNHFSYPQNEFFFFILLSRCLL